MSRSKFNKIENKHVILEAQDKILFFEKIIKSRNLLPKDWSKGKEKAQISSIIYFKDISAGLKVNKEIIKGYYDSLERL